MYKSESIQEISKALLKATAAMSGAKKNSNNPFFKSKYADYASVLEACKDSLNDHGISILQPTRVQDGEMFVETCLLHESGEFILSEMKVVMVKQDPQSMGSAITYARRYSLQSMVGLPAEDDDGERAMNRNAGGSTNNNKFETSLPKQAPSGVNKDIRQQKFTIPPEQKYVVDFGKKYKGQTLDEMGVENVKGMISYFMQDGNEPLPTQPAGRFLEAANAWLRKNQ